MLVFLVALLFSPVVFAQAAPVGSLCKALKEKSVAHVGDSLVPADIHPLDGSLGIVHIPIAIDLAQRYGLVFPPGAELKPDVALIGIHPDGRVSYNGQDLAADFTEICARKNLDNAKEGNGQEALDSLGSPSVK